MDPDGKRGEAVPLYKRKFNGYPEQPGQPVGPVVVDHTTEPPRDHIVWSILSLFSVFCLGLVEYIFCSILSPFYAISFCLGLAALFYSVKSRDRKMVGDMVGARHHSSTARTLNIVNAYLVVVLIIISIILFISNPFNFIAIHVLLGGSF